MPLNKHTYSKEGVTVLWEPAKCIHSGICVKGLPEVFNPQKLPWVDVNHAQSERIKQQVRMCPSGALSLLDDNNNP